MANILLSAASEVEPPAEASFMGLAVETRLQIYGYLLTPYLTEQDMEDYREHCCRQEGADFVFVGSLATNKVLACPCSALHLFPHILATSKQVYGEAAGVLYGNMELRVGLNNFWDRLAPLESAVRRLPQQCHAKVTRLLIAGALAMPHPVGKESRGLAGVTAFESYVQCIKATFPGLKSLRVHIDRTMVEDWLVVRDVKSIEPYAFLATIPKLQSMKVEVAGVANRRRDAIRATIQNAAKALETELQVEVVDCHRE